MLIHLKILMTQDTDWITRFPGQQHHLAERLVLKGHEVKVIDYKINWKKEHTKGFISKRKKTTHSKLFEEVNIEVISPSFIKIPILDCFSMFFSYSKEIKQQIRDFQPDIIIGHSILTNYISMRFAKKNNIPYIFHMTDAQHTIIPNKFLKPIGKLIEQHNLRNADSFIAINDKLKEYGISMGAEPSKSFVVKAGLEDEKFSPDIDGNPIREKYGIHKDEFVLFFMGWLYHFSGLKEVIKELGEKKEEYPNFKLMIVGEGDALEELQNLQKKYELYNNVIFAGKQPYDDIQNFIAAADICLLPAYNNDIMRNIVPIKLYHYMAMGKPVISTRLPGVFKEFCDGNGIVYIDLPEETIDTAMKIIGENKVADLGKKSYDFTKPYKWKNIVEDFEKQIMKTVKDF